MNLLAVIGQRYIILFSFFVFFYTRYRCQEIVKMLPRQMIYIF